MMENGQDNFLKIEHEINQLKLLDPQLREAVQADTVLSYLAGHISTIRKSADYINQLDLLQDLVGDLIIVKDLDTLAIKILEDAQKLIGFTDGAIGLVENNIIRFPHAIGENAESVKLFEIPVGDGLTGWVVQNKTLVNISDTTKDTRYKSQIGSTISELDVPIIYGDECFGVINAESSQVNSFSENDEKLLTTLARHAAIAIKNADSFKKLDLLREMANKLVDVRDTQQIAQDLLDDAQKIIPFTDAAIGLVDEGVIKFPHAIGHNADEVKNFTIPVGEGLTGWVVENKKPLLIKDTTNDPRYKAQIGTTKSELDVPILYKDNCLGVINLESTQPNAFSVEDEQFLMAFAEYVAIAFRNAKLFERNNALIAISKELSGSLNYDNVLDKILDTVIQTVRCTDASIALLDETKKTLDFPLAKGPSLTAVKEFTINIEQGLTGLAVQEKRPIRVGDVTSHPRYNHQITTTKSELDVPMIIGDEVIGVLNAESPNLNAFDDDDENLMVALAGHAAIAVKNAELYKKAVELRTAAETMAVLGDVAGNLVHRMNNDVGAIRVRATQIFNNTDDNTIKEKAKIIQELAAKVLGQFRTFRDRYKEESETKPLDINKSIQESIDSIPLPENVTIIANLAPELKRFWGNEEQIREVFRNVIANGIEAMPEGGQIWISSQQDAEKILVQVKDSGTGISIDKQDKIFERGFTTKHQGQGLGYGLWWVQTYLNRVGCQIELKESSERGSIFLITLRE